MGGKKKSPPSEEQIFTGVTLLKERSRGCKSEQKKFLTRKIIIIKKSPPAAEAGAALLHLTGAEEVGVTLMASSVIPVFRAAREEGGGRGGTRSSDRGRIVMTSFS